mgnify:CR=1 FL=1
MLATLILVWVQSSQESPELRRYPACLVTPGGALRFELELSRTPPESWKAFFVNGEERIPVPRVEFDGRTLVLDMPHYDSRIRAEWKEPRFVGTWQKRRSATELASLPFETLALACTNLGPPPIERFGGRWAVDFETDEHTAVALIQESPVLDDVRGTFLTSTGDYRYLNGTRSGPELTLSCFDGAHAFLFKARLQDGGTLAGDFWSGNWHHETWTAKRDESAELADAFAQTKWNGTTQLADLRFPDLDGKQRSLGEFAGQATLLVVFGSWCPNCHDEARLLKELDATYRARGLRILGLAFELTGEFARDAGQVRLFAARHALSIPYFLCGTADKDEATKALGLVDRVRAFPTTVFVGADGLPRAIHSGFAGPATGEEHAKLVRAFEERIEALLAAAPAQR